MRNTLITGLLLGLPAAVLLALVSLAVLAGKLRRRLGRGMNGRFSDLTVARPDREELRDDPTPAPVGRLYADPHEAPARGPCCQTPIAFPAGSRVIATHRSPSGYGMVVTSPPESVTLARASSMSCT
jgi:hypothetical protein